MSWFYPPVYYNWILFPLVAVVLLYIYRTIEDPERKKMMIALAAILGVLFSHYTRLEQLILQNQQLIAMQQVSTKVALDTASTVDKIEEQTKQKPKKRP